MIRSPAAAILGIAIALPLGACGKLKPNDPGGPGQPAKLRVAAKRRQEVCGSQIAYDRLKALVFDRAIAAHAGDRANLDTLSQYSTARMENPVVQGFDPALDITKCRGRFVLDMPFGAERGMSGERSLQADVDYTAQASADGNGLVYQVNGADPIVTKLAAFNLHGTAYRPPAGIDEGQSEPGAQVTAPPAPVAESNEIPSVPARPAVVPTRMPVTGAAPSTPRLPATLHQPQVAAARQPGALPETRNDGGVNDGPGEDVVRSFYDALGDGNGPAASAHVVPEKRAGRAFSADAISRFYGGLAEPLRLTGITPAGNGTYRVRYGYSSGRSYCNGSAVVTVTNRDGRALIRSIRSLSGC